MAYAIHCMNNISDKGIALLSSDYKLTDDLSQADGILVRSASLHDVEFPEGLRAIARAGAGVNNIPLDRCAEAGIVVFNTPGANANAVKELVIAGLMMGARDIAGGIRWCRDNADDPNIGKAAEKAKKAFAGTEIMGKKLGVIGLGAIGALVANAAVDLGMDVYGYDPFVSVDAAWRVSSAVHHVTNLDDIFATCDYLTIHVPALPDTIGMIGARAIAQMKGDVVVLNFSRDTLVDEAAMAAGLESGKVRRYITDFATPAVMMMQGAVVLAASGCLHRRGGGELRGDGRARADGLPGERQYHAFGELSRLRYGSASGRGRPHRGAARQRAQHDQPDLRRACRYGSQHRQPHQQGARRARLHLDRHRRARRRRGARRPARH